ncbi:hypothetical protein Nmul_A0112 [Nitrosospira multiformis ATCC 25196]|uniref:Uncharacterized protein n=1 Tax=Nitrosospira multiformis (strain ATCC 25196 / NCIMB 11849 / C 71) TaxID=323848 RepID=Q2YCV0_NITMU|nr:hypothetical protein Nmul_A0112 [Nitrosospira multiformis ATCC 25196]
MKQRKVMRRKYLNTEITLFYLMPLSLLSLKPVLMRFAQALFYLNEQPTRNDTLGIRKSTRIEECFQFKQAKWIVKAFFRVTKRD